MKRYIIFLVFAFILQGCYTRLAVKESNPQYSYYEDSDVYDDDNVAYDTVYYDENEPKYRGFEDRIVNNYYINMDSYPIFPYSRIIISSGFYDPYIAWDYYWYVNSWWSPRIYFDGFYFGYYWRPYHYSYWYDWYPYYYYGYNYGYNYNGGYSSNGTHPGKTRDNDGGRRTRNDGRTLTNSFGGTTRENTFTGREILKDREKVTRTDEQIRKLNEDRGIPTDRLRGTKREVIIDRDGNDNNVNRKIIIKDDNGNRIIKEYTPRTNENNRRNEIDGSTNREYKERKKIYIQRDNEERRTVERKTNRETESRDFEPRVNRERNNDNSNRNRNYEPPIKQNREETPKREYRNEPPQRNFNPPVNNNSGNNNRGSNDGSRNSGTRERR
jgi:hypothetical protein